MEHLNGRSYVIVDFKILNGFIHAELLDGRMIICWEETVKFKLL